VPARRDDFSPTVVAKARDLVSSICSNPACGVFTMSAQLADTGELTNVGTASHIHAAAEGGPRYDSKQTREERRGIANAVWLCATCARLIDSDIEAHPPDLLRKWKADAEQKARARIGKRATTVDEAGAEEHSRIARQLDEVVRQMGALAATAQATAFARRLDLRPPPLVAAVIVRDATVARIVSSLGARRWLALHGEVAIGKTHLAALIARVRGDSIWIRTRGVDNPEAAARVKEVIAQRAGSFPPTVVVDNLPPAREELVDALVHLLNAVGDSAVLITTSNHCLGSNVRQYVAPKLLLEEPCPALTDDEAATLLRAHGAENLSSKAAAFLNALAHRRPALLTAIARYLASRGWVWDEKTVGALFSHDHLSGVNSETLRALTESVSAEASRSLLYRLTLVRGAFDEALARQLGAVSPALPLVHERLAELEGLWIQRQNDNWFTASPLVSALPHTVVDQQARLACFKILGAQAMSGTITPASLVDATVYYAQGREFDQAAQVLSFGLVSFAFEQRRVSPGDMLLIWWDAPLPAELSPDNAVSLRCAQIAAGVRASKNIDALASDLATRLSMSGLSWGHVVGASVAFQALMKSHARTAIALLRVALRDFDKATLPNGESVSMHAPIRLELLAWLVAIELRTPEQISDWVELVLTLPPSSLTKKRGWLAFHEACLHVVDGVWLREVDKLSQDQDWPGVGALLTSIRSAAIANANAFVAAVATRAKMIVLAEYEGRIDEAIALGRETLDKVVGDPRGAYLIQECEGRQELYRGRTQIARAALDAALATLGDDRAGGMNVLLTLTSAACASWRTAPADAVAYMRRAKVVATTLGKAGRLELARVCGELAIACEHVGNRDEAYAVLATGADALLASSRTSEAWRRIAAIFAHSAGYIARVMTTGTPPPTLPDGEPFARPEQGVFYLASRDVQRILRPQAMASVCVMLAEFASALGADDDALRWGNRTLEEADADPSGEAPQFTALALPNMIRGALGDVSALADIIVATAKATRARLDASQADTFVLALSMLPLSSEILRLSVDDNAAVTLCEQAARLCTEVAGRLDESSTWKATATALRLAASKDGSVTDLIRFANETVTSGMEGVHMVAALLASVDERRSLGAVAQAHLAVLGVLEGPNLAHIRGRLLANVEQYWRGMVTRAPFRFSHPAVLKAELSAARDGTIVESAAFVLRAVAADLGVRH
jgi:hypothetical protein